MSDGEKKIPETFAMRELVEELRTLLKERQDFLATKMRKNTIGEIEANLYRYRLARLRHAGIVMKQFQDGGHETEHDRSMYGRASVSAAEAFAAVAAQEPENPPAPEPAEVPFDD